MSIAKTALDGIWNDIITVCEGSRLVSPGGQSTFMVSDVREDELGITLRSEKPMNISKAAFEAALHYLLEHGHHAQAPCEIRSSQTYEKAGPLCQVARTNGTRNSTYVLPILQKMGLVGIKPRSSGVVSAAWYIA